MSSFFSDSQSRALCNGEQCDAETAHKLPTVCLTSPMRCGLISYSSFPSRLLFLFLFQFRPGWHLLSASEGILLSVDLPLIVFFFLDISGQFEAPLLWLTQRATAHHLELLRGAAVSTVINFPCCACCSITDALKAHLYFFPFVSSVWCYVTRPCEIICNTCDWITK